MQLPAVIIGIGETGANTAAALYQLWNQVFRPQSLAQSFVAIVPPNSTVALPDESVYVLDPSPEDVVSYLLANPDQSELFSSWFDPQHWRRKTFTLPYPRPIERLLFAQTVAQRENAPMMKALLNRLQNDRFRANPQVILIADLGEAFGSSLVPDLAHLTRQMARVNLAQSPSITAYTVLSEDTLQRTYAALRELARFQDTAHPLRSYPFYYAMSGGSSGIWRGGIAGQLLDFWNVYDSTPQTLEAMTGAIFARLQPKMVDQLKADEVNLKSQIHRAEGFANTENAYIIATPAHQITDQWEQALMHQSLELALEMPTDDALNEQRDTFWRDFTQTRLFASLQSPNLRGRVFEGDVASRVAALDKMLFPPFVTALVPDLPIRRLPQEILITDAPERPAEMCQWTNEVLEPLKKRYPLDKPASSTYAVWLDSAYTHLLNSFRTRIDTQVMQPLISPDADLSLGGAIALVERLLADLHAARDLLRTALNDAEYQLAERERAVISLEQSLRKLHSACRNLNPLKSTLSLGTQDLKKAFQWAIQDLIDITDVVCWHNQVALTAKLVDAAIQLVESDYQRPLSRWRTHLQSSLNRLDVDTLLELSTNQRATFLPDTLDDHWLTRRTQAFPVPQWIAWAYTEEHGLQLRIGSHDMLSLTERQLQNKLHAQLLAQAKTITDNELPILTLANALAIKITDEEQLTLPRELAQRTVVAEDTPLHFTPEMGKSHRTRKAYISYPQPTNTDAQPFLDELLDHIRSRHHQSAQQEQHINPVHTDENMPLVYLYLTRFVHLPTESVTYSRLSRAYRTAKQPIQHIFAGEQTAVAVELWMRGQNYDIGELSPDVVKMLYHPDLVTAFAMGCALTNPRIPTLFKDNTAQLNDAEKLMNALHAFASESVTQESVGQQHDSIVRNFNFSGTPPPQYAYGFELSNRPTTPRHTVVKLRQLMANCYQFDTYQAWALSQRPIQRDDDPLLFDLYTVFEYLLHQRRESLYQQLIDEQTALSGWIS